MKRILPLALLGLACAGTAMAQDDGSQIILPVEAQTCDLPTAPARIPETPSYDDLVAAKDRVSEFQTSLASYRECLDGAGDPELMTEGNRIALNQAHNYSVEMEERVAADFDNRDNN